jgi:hypothetical protein
VDSALHYATYRKNVKLVKLLIERGANVKATTPEMLQTVAHFCALGGDLACMVAIREAGTASHSGRPSYLRTCLLVALLSRPFSLEHRGRVRHQMLPV